MTVEPLQILFGAVAVTATLVLWGFVRRRERRDVAWADERLRELSRRVVETGEKLDGHIADGYLSQVLASKSTARSAKGSMRGSRRRRRKSRRKKPRE